MTMDISNHNKLSEFYEELKRLNIKIQRPDIINAILILNQKIIFSITH